MSLLIKGMEMPKPDENGLETTMRLVLSSSGLVELIDPDTNTLLEEYRAIEVPTPHGRLIDADALEVDTEWEAYQDGYTAYSRLQIDAAPTVIEAEK